jgi:hypothetical protein
MKFSRRAALVAAFFALFSSSVFAQVDQPVSGIDTKLIVFVIFIILVSGAAGLFWILSAQRSARRAQVSAAWPQAPGKVILCELARRTVSGKYGGTFYRPLIHYAYEVGGQAYQSDVVSFGNLETNTSLQPQTYLAKYPLGVDVSVRYDPADPNVSTLETEAAVGTYLTLGTFMLVFAAIGVVFLAYLLALA